MTETADTLDAAADAKLSEADREALDALMEVGFEPHRVDASVAERAQAIAGLLAPLDGRDENQQQSGLVDRVFSAVIDARDQGPGEPPRTDQTLSPESEDAVDAFVMNGLHSGRVPSRYVGRASVLEGWDAYLTRLSPAGEAWLGESREARVAAAAQAVMEAGEAPAISIESGRGRGRGGRIWDLIAAASVVLIASAVIMPIVGMVRASAIESACLAHFGTTSQAFGMYADAHEDELPMATAGFGGSWMRVGEDPKRSNSANLFTLARSDYATLEALSCPGNPRAPTAMTDPDAKDWSSLEEISFSYQILPGSRRPRHMLPSGSILVTDRSPVILRAARNEPIIPEANSPNHRGEGQHVLRLDGSVTWHKDPVLEGGDNLWLPRAIENLLHTVRSRVGLVDGDEFPDSPEDAFVGP